MNLGEKLKFLRNQRNLTQKTVCHVLNISRSVYSQYELNEREPSLKRLIALARFYMSSIDYLCDNTDRVTIDITELSEEQRRIMYAMLRKVIVMNVDNKD